MRLIKVTFRSRENRGIQERILIRNQATFEEEVFEGSSCIKCKMNIHKSLYKNELEWLICLNEGDV
jgi:hypothetical protein